VRQAARSGIDHVPAWRAAEHGPACSDIFRFGLGLRLFGRSARGGDDKERDEATQSGDAKFSVEHTNVSKASKEGNISIAGGHLFGLHNARSPSALCAV